MEAGLPSSSELVEYLITESKLEKLSTIQNPDLDKICEFLSHEPGYGRHWINESLKKIFQDKMSHIKYPYCDGHMILPQIQWRDVFTTNYDRLIESSYEKNEDTLSFPIVFSNPDDDVNTHHEGYTRIIKIHGSLDELIRNSTHKLVLTFADQKQNYHDRKHFYDKLYSNAVDGPIVFIGYSLTHPGSTRKGTSYEIEILNRILSRMDEATRYHYYISPYDEEDIDTELFLRQLRSLKIVPINLAFSDFLSTVFSLLSSDNEPIKKQPPIVIPVGTQELSIEYQDYLNLTKQVEIIDTSIILQDPPTVDDSLNGKDNWASYVHKHFIKRLCHDDFTSLIDSVTEAEDVSIIRFSSSIGWGKSTFLKQISVEYMQKGYPVIWLNPLSSIEIPTEEGDIITLGRWDSREIAHILSEIQNILIENEINTIKPILILDNSYDRQHEFFLLVQELIKRKIPLLPIISAREDELDLQSDECSPQISIIDFSPDEDIDRFEEIDLLIDHAIKNQVSNITDDSNRDLIHANIMIDEAYIAIIFALQVIYDKEHRPFTEIVSSMWNDIPTSIGRELLLSVCSINRFGSIYQPRSYTVFKTINDVPLNRIYDAYSHSLENNILYEREFDSEFYVSTYHPLIADKILIINDIPIIEIEARLMRIFQHFAGGKRELELLRRFSKGINDYEYTFSSEEKTREIYKILIQNSKGDWVCCQQYSKYLLNQQEFEEALRYIEMAIKNNPSHAPIFHSKGNILFKWGKHQFINGNIQKANSLFDKAAQFLTMSRNRPIPDEYGYVTHLDLLLFRIEKEKDEDIKRDLIIEGIKLYRNGLEFLPSEDVNFLLQEKYQKSFDPTGDVIERLLDKIKDDFQKKQVSATAINFLVTTLFHEQKETIPALITIIEEFQVTIHESALLYITETELYLSISDITSARKSIENANRTITESEKEDKSVYGKMMYYDMILSFIHSDFTRARESYSALLKINYSPRRSLPLGYIWKESAKSIQQDKRTLKKDAVRFTGRIETVKSTGYGEVSLTNEIGEVFYIPFHKNYFRHFSYRRGTPVNFAIAIMPNRLRAESLNSKPFQNTQNDIYLNL